MNWQDFISSNWFKYLEPDHQAIVRTAIKLLEKHQEQNELEDYSFIIFLMAKVYEAFIKKYLLDSGLIDFSLYKSKRFRIGRALNPDVRKNQRDHWWLYDDIVQSCGEEVADALWKTWLECRNRIVHSFPGEHTLFSLAEAEKKVLQITKTMEMAQSCATYNK